VQKCRRLLSRQQQIKNTKKPKKSSSKQSIITTHKAAKRVIEEWNTKAKANEEEVKTYLKIVDIA